jgi:hypothetical protein
MASLPSFYSNIPCVQLAIPLAMVASLKEELSSIVTLYTPALLHLQQLLDTYDLSLSEPLPEGQTRPLFLDSPSTSPATSPTTSSRTQEPQSRLKKRKSGLFRNGNRSAPPSWSARITELARDRVLRLKDVEMEASETDGEEELENKIGESDDVAEVRD